MTNQVDLNMVERPVDVALAAAELSLDKAIESLERPGLIAAGLMAAGIKEALHAATVAGKAGLDGAHKLNHGVAAYVDTQRVCLEATCHVARSESSKLAAITTATVNEAALALQQDGTAINKGRWNIA
jgi:hypothetical protein